MFLILNVLFCSLFEQFQTQNMIVKKGQIILTKAISDVRGKFNK